MGNDVKSLNIFPGNAKKNITHISFDPFAEEKHISNNDNTKYNNKNYFKSFPIKNHQQIKNMSTVRIPTSVDDDGDKNPSSKLSWISNKHKHTNLLDLKYRPIYSPINFWLEDPTVLFQVTDIIPNNNMTNIERLNAMTRVIIIIAAIMFVVKFPLWWMFLVIGVITVIILWYILKVRDDFYSNRQIEYLRRPTTIKKKILQPLNNKHRPAQSAQKQIINLISIP